HERDLRAKLEVILLLVRALVAFEGVVRKVERLDPTYNLLIKPFVGGLKIILNRMKLAGWPGDLFATNHGVRVGAPHELPCATDHHFFQQIENTDTPGLDRVA